MDKLFVTCAVIFAAAGAVTDARTRRIPNRLTYSAFFAALILRSFMVGWHGFRDGLAGALIGGGLFFFLFFIGGMGAGDVKLMAAISSWVGAGHVADLLMATALAGGAMAIVVMLNRRRVFTTLMNTFELIRHHLLFGLRPHPKLNIKDPDSMRVPFAPAIAAGALYCLSIVTLWG